MTKLVRLVEETGVRLQFHNSAVVIIADGDVCYVVFSLAVSGGTVTKSSLSNERKIQGLICERCTNVKGAVAMMKCHGKNLLKFNRP